MTVTGSIAKGLVIGFQGITLGVKTLSGIARGLSIACDQEVASRTKVALIGTETLVIITNWTSFGLDAVDGNPRTMIYIKGVDATAEITAIATRVLCNPSAANKRKGGIDLLIATAFHGSSFACYGAKHNLFNQTPSARKRTELIASSIELMLAIGLAVQGGRKAYQDYRLYRSEREGMRFSSGDVSEGTMRIITAASGDWQEALANALEVIPDLAEDILADTLDEVTETPQLYRKETPIEMAHYVCPINGYLIRHVQQVKGTTVYYEKQALQNWANTHSGETTPPKWPEGITWAMDNVKDSLPAQEQIDTFLKEEICELRVGSIKIIRNVLQHSYEHELDNITKEQLSTLLERLKRTQHNWE